MPCLVIRLKTFLMSFFHNIIYLFLEFHLFGLVNLQALYLLHCNIRNMQIISIIHNKTTIFGMYNWMLQQKEKFNCRLESKVEVTYNKENVLWTYIVNRTWKCRIRCQNT
jgi:hypothetical protein